jgi:hypothetical protein
VKLGSALVDEVRRRVQQHTLGHRGRNSDPLYGIRRTGLEGPILAYFDTNGASNGPTEAINGVIETTRRIARGLRNFTNYRLRCLLAAGGHRPYLIQQTNHA